MKDNDSVVAFMQAQIVKNNDKGRIEGIRNLSYVEPKYSGKTGETVDTYGNLYIGFYSESIYQDISQWFGENDVNYEKISTGINMSHHIATYIKRKKFIPVNKNKKTLFLEKDLKKQLYRRSLDKIYRLYYMHEQRTTHTTVSDILTKINNTPELVFLSDEQKMGLVRCFLKEEKEELKNQTRNSKSKSKISQDNTER